MQLEDDLLTDDIRPTTSGSLAVHSNKIEELKKWLSTSFATKENIFPNVLFLSGPTGSGKSTSVTVLCEELKINLIEFEQERLYNDKLEVVDNGLTSLTTFLKQTGARLLPGKPRKTILFVTELPDEAFNDPQKFRSQMAESLYSIHLPVIFCLSDVDSCWHLNPNRLFNNSFIEENQIRVLKFNPVAVTYLKNALKRAARILSIPLTDGKITVISTEANGDLRVAMNMVHVNSIGNNNRKKANVLCVGRSNREDAFHMLGRILHAKRVDDNGTPIGQKKRKKVENRAPLKYRTELEHDANEIIQMSSMSSDKLINFLFENELKFDPSLPRYRKIIDSISLCDSMVSEWQVKLRLPDEYMSQIATRSVMYHNFGNKKANFLSLKGPLMSDLNRDIANSVANIRRLPMIGNTKYASLDAPFNNIIEGVIDPNKIDCYLARPMNISWKQGRDGVQAQMTSMASSAFYKRKAQQHMRKLQSQRKTKVVNSDEEEEEKIVIEDSEDDSFDEF